MATSDASVMTLTGASGLGCTKRVTLASVSLICWKASVAAGVHCRVQLFVAVDFNSELSGVRMVAHCGIKRW